MPTAERKLAAELDLFERNRKEWLRSHPGEFVVIAGASIAGFYPDYEAAFKAGLEMVGLGKSFLVKQIWAEEPVYLIH